MKGLNKNMKIPNSQICHFFGVFNDISGTRSNACCQVPEKIPFIMLTEKTDIPFFLSLVFLREVSFERKSLHLKNSKTLDRWSVYSREE